VWTCGYGPSPGNSSALPLLPKDSLPVRDPNSASKVLSSITDDQGRRVVYWLDVSGQPYVVRSNQAVDSGLNLVTYQQCGVSGETERKRFDLFANDPGLFAGRICVAPIGILSFRQDSAAVVTLCAFASLRETNLFVWLRLCRAM